jgi:hypothetical protein
MYGTIVPPSIAYLPCLTENGRIAFEGRERHERQKSLLSAGGTYAIKLSRDSH